VRDEVGARVVFKASELFEKAELKKVAV